MKLLLIGESCIDIFKYGIVERICPEAPCAVFKTTHEVCNEGMAANVLANIKAIAPADWQIDFITNDIKPQKIRYVEVKSNQMLLREDVDDRVEEWNAWRVGVTYDCVIVSDYDKGFLNREQLLWLSTAATISFLDTKKPLDTFAKNFTFIKVNEPEYKRSLMPLPNVIVTAGANGAYYKGEHFQVPQVPIVDVAGAGDTFLAGLVVMYLLTKNIKHTINYANECANLVVQKRGVCTV